MCIDIVAIWFGIANGQISSIFDGYLPETCPYFSFRIITSSKHQWIFTKLGMCIDIVEIWFGIANGQIWSTFCQSYLPDGIPMESQVGFRQDPTGIKLWDPSRDSRLGFQSQLGFQVITHGIPSNPSWDSRYSQLGFPLIPAGIPDNPSWDSR